MAAGRTRKQESIRKRMEASRRALERTRRNVDVNRSMRITEREKRELYEVTDEEKLVNVSKRIRRLQDELSEDKLILSLDEDMLMLEDNDPRKMSNLLKIENLRLTDHLANILHRHLSKRERKISINDFIILLKKLERRRRDILNNRPIKPLLMQYSPEQIESMGAKILTETEQVPEIFLSRSQLNAFDRVVGRMLYDNKKRLQTLRAERTRLGRKRNIKKKNETKKFKKQKRKQKRKQK
jgi:hypothetical protein